MKIVPRRAAQADDAAQQEDTTTEFPAGPEQMVHRRTTVTVERETVSFLMRRPVAEPVVTGADQPVSEVDAPKLFSPDLPAPSAETRNEVIEGKP
jgi:hypothetical protein